MRERILVIGDKEHDVDLLSTILEPQGFDMDATAVSQGIEDALVKDEYAAIVVDYDFIGNQIFYWTELLQQHRCKSFFILFGEHVDTEQISELLQAGVYGFVPRSLLSQRMVATLQGGLENRRAFIEILGMINGLGNINDVAKQPAETPADDLNEVSRQKAFRECLKREFHRAKRYHRPLSLMILRVSNLNMVIESLDNQTIDMFLEEMAASLKDALRLMDILYRYSEDGFVILLPETEMTKAETLAKRLVSAAQNGAFRWNSKKAVIEITYGVSATSEIGEQEMENALISMANNRLQKTKSFYDFI